MYKWEEGLIALDLELVEELKGGKVLVRMDGFEFIVPKSNLNQRCSPTIKSCTDKTKYFLHKYSGVLNLKLDYSELEYLNNRDKVKVICQTHGALWMRPMSLILGHGCRFCRYERCEGFLSRSTYEAVHSCYVYVIRIRGVVSGEDFLKIGMSKNPNLRCNSIKSQSGGEYSAEVLYTYEADGVTCWDLEKLLHKEFSELRCQPKYNFEGSTECFKGVNLDEIKKVVQCCT